MAPQEGVAGNLVVAVAPVFDAVAVSLKVGLIRLPAEGFHIFQRGLAVERHDLDVTFPDLLGLLPSPFLGDPERGDHGPRVDAVVVIDIPVQIDPAGDDMEVLDAAVAVLVEHHDVLAIPEVRGFRAFPLGHP